MAKNLYDIENLDAQTVKFTVRPLPAFGWFRKLLILVALVAEFLACAAINVTFGFLVTALVAAFLIWAMTGGSWNRGRRRIQFVVSPAGITFHEGGAATTTLAPGDIERLFITAPKAGETVIHSGFAGGRAYTGVSSTGGINASLAARSWQVVVQARGVEHWLGGGLTEPQASSLAVQVQRALPGSWR
ncbi:MULTISPECIES: hypothetical protein [Burkholderia]|uniref:hypothetical protein n=1 Tax=Burkholderia TaxID=32008 RepID=UPI000759C653|nr:MULTISPECIES: hypothetical protein [Burkholderia]KVE75814.1 hypothetical protein WI98_11950 [Burkholderia vietnamiensis]MCM2539254.1 hypothetical protein [Burkholderia glumae]